jgi:uncharacterized membrane protein YdjX (TVP38/TMEM64 family)
MHGGDPTSPKPIGTTARLLLLVVVLLAALLLVHLTPIRDWLDDVERVRTLAAEVGGWVYPLSVLAVALLVCAGLPRLLLCGLCGMLFGFWVGLIIAQTGGLLGHYATFLFVRWAGREWVMQRWPKLSKWAQVVRQQGIVGVILARQLPLHAALINLGLGLSHVRHIHFLIGTAFGTLPEAIVATLVGAGLVRPSLAGSATDLSVAAAAFAAIWIACGYALRALRERDSAAAGFPGGSSHD